MTNYDYRQAMKEDVKAYIEYEVENISGYDRDALEEKLNDELWVADCVTGNASCSYTFNSCEAKEYVTDNMDLCINALKEFCVDAETIAEKFLCEDWEYFDVTIRCFLLSEIISDVLDEMGC